jgi:hypothetical protein
MNRALKAVSVGIILPLALGLIATLGTGAAFAKGKGGGGGGPVTFTGSTTCSVNGKVTFSPALKTGSTGTSSATVTASLTGCTNATQGGVTLTTGHLQGLSGSVSPNGCTAVASGPIPPLSGGSIKWTPTSMVKPSSGGSFPAGTGSVVTSGGTSVVQLHYTGGSIASGSFTNSGGTSVTVTSTQDTTQLLARCTNGLSSVTFKGTATL